MSVEHKYEEAASGVYINSDAEGLAQYKAKKQQSKRVEEISSDINSLKSELTEIKEALKFLIEKN
jgi:hypothetical protein